MEISPLSTPAYAKINLALAITGVREDGYHELQSVMQSIALHDTVSLRRWGEEVVCRCGHLSGTQNLAHQAAVLFLEELGLTEGLEIEIDKQIPLQAGLAGGSTDAAAVLGLLNQMYGEPLSEADLLKLAGKCGADVAFCLKGGTMWATGRGEQLEPLPSAPDLDLVLVKPAAGVDTKEAYRRLDELGRRGWLKREDWEEALREKSTERIVALLDNDLEPVSSQIVPEIPILKQHLLDAGCQGALMSGSGSLVFGIVRGKEQGNEVAEYLRKKGFKDIWLTKTVKECNR